mmetsp:Transcript_65684/g.122454  ORF Transcript_65684/g.122454 Transcript_65684/m.122454 type:complete len:295 (-) Transcript_65684:252-1136(-)
MAAAASHRSYATLPVRRLREARTMHSTSGYPPMQETTIHAVHRRPETLPAPSSPSTPSSTLQARPVSLTESEMSLPVGHHMRHQPVSPMSPSSARIMGWPGRRAASFMLEQAPARRYFLRPPRTLQDGDMHGFPRKQCLSGDEDEVCAICLEPLQVGEMVQPMVRCHHLFHHTCVRAFVDARRREQQSQGHICAPLGECIACPLCRGRLAAFTLSEVPSQEHDQMVPLDASSDALLRAAGSQAHTSLASPSTLDRSHFSMAHSPLPTHGSPTRTLSLDSLARSSWHWPLHSSSL